MKINKLGRFVNEYENILTKEILEEKYKELKTLKNVGKYFGVSGDCIKKYMELHNIPYNKKIRYVCDDEFFSRDNEESFYWAGFFAADGNVSKKNDICLGLATKDILHIEKFKRAIKTDAPIITRMRLNKFPNQSEITTSSSSLRIRCHQMATDLKRFNIVPNKTKIYTIPNWLLHHNLIRHFIRGYFDGDGWFSIQKKENRLIWGICGNLSVIKDIKYVLSKYCGINNDIGSITKQLNIYKLFINKQHDVFNISNYLYNHSTIYLERKYKISKDAKYFDDKTIILNLNKDDLQERYQRLKSYKLVAKELNCSTSAICKYANRYNIKKYK